MANRVVFLIDRRLQDPLERAGDLCSLSGDRGTLAEVLTGHRHIKNRRLAAVGPIWALGSLRASPGARRHFDARRAAGDWNHQAQRHLFNKFLGQLHHCLQTGQLYNEHLAFPPPLPLAA
jgi:hypothetical protein